MDGSINISIMFLAFSHDLNLSFFSHSLPLLHKIIEALWCYSLEANMITFSS